MADVPPYMWPAARLRHSMALHVNTVHSHPQRLLPLRIFQIRGQERPLLPAEGDVYRKMQRAVSGHAVWGLCEAYVKVNLYVRRTWAGVGSMTEGSRHGFEVAFLAGGTYGAGTDRVLA